MSDGPRYGHHRQLYERIVRGHGLGEAIAREEIPVGGLLELRCSPRGQLWLCYEDPNTYTAAPSLKPIIGSMVGTRLLLGGVAHPDAVLVEVIVDNDTEIARPNRAHAWLITFDQKTRPFEATVRQLADEGHLLEETTLPFRVGSARPPRPRTWWRSRKLRIRSGSTRYGSTRDGGKR